MIEAVAAGLASISARFEARWRAISGEADKTSVKPRRAGPSASSRQSSGSSVFLRRGLGGDVMSRVGLQGLQENLRSLFVILKGFRFWVKIG